MLRGIYSMVMAPEGDGGGGGGGGGGAPAGGGAPPATPPAAGGSLLTQGGGAPPATPPAAGGGAPPPGTPPATPPGTPPTLEDWKASLPEELRNSPSINKFLDIAGLAKGYQSLEKTLGADKVAIPGKHATEEDWRNFYQRIGQPANLQDYKVELPNDAGFDENFVSQLREEAFKLNILPQQLNKLLGWYSTANKTAIEKMNEEYKSKMVEGLGNLQKEWGQAFEDKVSLAKRGAKYFAEKNGIPNINTWLDGTGMGDDPVMIKMLAFLGGFLKEDNIHGAEFAPANQTPNQIQAEIGQIMGDPKNPYFDKTHPNHKAAVDHMQKLYSALHPTAS